MKSRILSKRCIASVCSFGVWGGDNDVHTDLTVKFPIDHPSFSTFVKLGIIGITVPALPSLTRLLAQFVPSAPVSPSENPLTLMNLPVPVRMAFHDRRRWLQAVSTATFSACWASEAGGTAGSENRHLAASSSSIQMEPGRGGYIDAHSHIWTRDITNYPLSGGAKLEDLDPPSFTWDELLVLLKHHLVDRVVLIQHHKFYGFDNRYMTDAVTQVHDLFRVVGMVDDQSSSPDLQMRALLKRGVTGFRITSWIRGRKWLSGPGMDSMWRCAADTGQSICCLMDPPYLASLNAMCRRHPGTKVVIDHFARIGADGIIRQRDVKRLCRIARHRNTHVKISAYYALGKKKAPYMDLVPMIRQLLDAFGPHRLMWASDSPYQLQDGHTYASSLALVRDRLEFLSAGDRDLLLRGTAARVYWL